jgi:hypothetical protein
VSASKKKKVTYFQYTMNGNCKYSHCKREEWPLKGGIGSKQDQNPAGQTLNPVTPPLFLEHVVL